MQLLSSENSKGVQPMRRISALFFGLLFIIVGQSAFGQTAKLIEAAKKEGGKVVVYTSMETFTADSLKKAFETKTGLQMEYWRGASTEILDRVLSEHRIGKPIFVESIVPAADRVGTGETPIGITFVRFVLTYNKQGANLDYVRDYQMLGDGQYINLGAKAPRPNAGKAFIDFFLDEESMKIQAETGEFVNRKGIYPPLADADKIKFVQMYSFGKKDYEEKQKEYQKIFLQ